MGIRVLLIVLFLADSSRLYFCQKGGVESEEGMEDSLDHGTDESSEEDNDEKSVLYVDMKEVLKAKKRATKEKRREADTSSPTEKDHDGDAGLESSVLNSLHTLLGQYGLHEKVAANVEVSYLPEEQSEVTGGSTEASRDTPAWEKSSDEEPEESIDSEVAYGTGPGSMEYIKAMEILNSPNPDYDQALQLLFISGRLNHTGALHRLAKAYLFGDWLDQNISQAFEIFQFLADEGNPAGHQGLSFLYSAGLYVNVSLSRALLHSSIAAMGGDVLAQLYLGYHFNWGIGVEEDCEKALFYFKRAAKLAVKSQRDRFSGGPLLQKTRLYDEEDQEGGSSLQLDENMVHYYSYLAEKGDLKAQLTLGSLYYHGAHGLSIDFLLSCKYFEMAASAGNTEAMAYLGRIYAEGSPSVPQSNETALKYFTQALESDNLIALSGLGKMHLLGQGVPVNYDKAMQFFQKAAEAGAVEGYLNLALMYYEGLGRDKDLRTALKHFMVAAQSGNILAMYYIAAMHEQGQSIVRSCSTAVSLYRSVCERVHLGGQLSEAFTKYQAGDFDGALVQYYFLAEIGFEVAQSNAAYLLEKGLPSIIPKDEVLPRTLILLKKAAAQGYQQAMIRAGDYFFYGLSTNVDYDKSVKYYRQAADQQNNAQALFNLGYMHEQGLGLPKDFHLAKRFYDMSIASSPDASLPVTLALFRLTFWMMLEHFSQKRLVLDKLQLSVNVPVNWDIYLISILAGLLGIIALTRRRRNI